VTYENLSEWSGFSIRSLEEKFHNLLDLEPPLNLLPQPLTEEVYLLIDGLWFGKRFCLMLYRRSKDKLLLRVSFMAKEYGSLIAKDLIALRSDGHRFTGAVSDGGTGVKKAIVKVFGHIPHQICMAHLHRQAVNALGVHPKDLNVRRLKELADWVWNIESKEALRWWKDQYHQWYLDNWSYLNEYRRDEKGHWWYIHKGVRKAARTLVYLADYSFEFLDHPLMPKTTNEIEATFGVMSTKQGIHKGLKRERIEGFLKWFVYFYNRNILSQRKNKKA